MNELVTQEIHLPDTMQDLASFVLVGREKLVAVRAEIRAIDKLQLAEEVRNQKKQEAQMLSEALLDAEVRLGDLLKEIPKAPRVENLRSNSGVTSVKDLSFRGNQYTGKMINNSDIIDQPTKTKVISDLGFTPMQVNRFETLANNKDLVEQVKQEARENNAIPTRTRVIDLSQKRKKQEQKQQNSVIEYDSYLDKCYEVGNKIHDTLFALHSMNISDEFLKQFSEYLDNPFSKKENFILEDLIVFTEDAIPKLLKIQKFLKELRK